MILWPSKGQAVRVNVPRTTLSAPIEYDHATTKRVVAKYTATKKVFTITREHSTNTIRSENGWSNNPAKMKIFQTQRDAEKYMSARKIVGKIVMFESR